MLKRKSVAFSLWVARRGEQLSAFFTSLAEFIKTGKWPEKTSEKGGDDEAAR